MRRPSLPATLARGLRLAAGAALIPLAGAAWAGPAAGQGAGTAASTLLRVAPGPRPLAMGHAMVAIGDAFALEHNPAALDPDHAGVAAAYQALPVDASAGAAAAVFPMARGTAGVSLRFIDYGAVDVIVERPGLPVGEPTGATATGGEVTLVAGYAIAVGPLRLGLGARWLRLDVAGLIDEATAADAGILLRIGERIALAAAAQNLGEDVRAGRAAPLPRTFRVGGRLQHRVGPLDALLAVEARHREDRLGWGSGLELAGGGPALRAVARVGLETRPRSGDAFAPIVFGGGLRLDRIGVDFAYRALGPLGSTRQVGLAYRF